ncbi:hypothetical protein QLX08_004004 [Tetragonisca angustula]|uniref:Endonuclease/exonuclease/phosphatase domain-containing protein n=1 Tax=Tetragonisca angustula TaxID=166442 RepID=A0AAW1A472_9HYME
MDAEKRMGKDQELPKGYDWHRQDASRKDRKGRAIGRMLVGVKKNLAVEEKILVEKGVIKLKVRMKHDVWRLAGIYALGDVEGKIEQIKDWMEIGEKEEKIIIGGDLNVRMGELGERI